MGSYPYPSSYVQPEGGLLPAWPVNAACGIVKQAQNSLQGLALAAFMFYNATGDKTCFYNSAQQHQSPLGKSLMRTKLTLSSTAPTCAMGNWDWQWCTEHVMPFTQGTEHDMFYPFSGSLCPVKE